MANFDFDTIVIGSGFGGAVSACRLAEKKHKVLVLERGRRWSPDNYPRTPADHWFWDNDEPEDQNGWVDLRLMKNMAVATAAGVGGGSLIYASVFIEAKPSVFNSGWPEEISYKGLKPYYDKATAMLAVQTIPDGQLTKRFQLMQEGAEKLGFGSRFHKVNLAVNFDPDYNPSQPDNENPSYSKTFTNPHGKTQGTCVHCGNCDIGCDVQAKNTLDLNYLAIAENLGTEIRPLHRVIKIEPWQQGYKVHFEDLNTGKRIKGFATAQRVILSAGSIGSTEILLHSRDQYKTLPKLSKKLGYRWSANGDFVTPAFYGERNIAPTQGPTITCAIDLLDGQVDGQSVFIEDGGFPNVLDNYIQRRLKQSKHNKKARHFWTALRQEATIDNPLHNVMPWFGQGIDGGDGQLYLGRVWYAPWRRKMKMNWDATRSAPTITAMIKVHENLSTATGGKAWVPPTWTVFDDLITPHPLGGCSMGSSAENGVVNHKGEVFGYPNLYVVDGAIIPRPLGLNPSCTITALAERIVDLMD